MPLGQAASRIVAFIFSSTSSATAARAGPSCLGPFFTKQPWRAKAFDRAGVPGIGGPGKYWSAGLGLRREYLR